jgi:hypothetical protein
VPAFYKLLAKKTGSPRTISRRLDALTKTSEAQAQDASFSR